MRRRQAFAEIQVRSASQIREDSRRYCVECQKFFKTEHGLKVHKAKAHVNN